MNVSCFVVKGLDLEWCKQPDSGLPKPDLVLLLNLTPEAQRARGGFGAERYEKDEIQRKVIEIYKTLQDSSWKVIHSIFVATSFIFVKILHILFLFYI